MAKREINGKDILLFIDPAGGEDYDLIICLTSNSINMTSEVINSSSKCGTSSSPGTDTNDVPFEGNFWADPDTGKISGGDLFTLKKNKTNFSWKMGPATPVAGDPIFTSTGFLSSLTLTFPDGVATFSGTISSDEIEYAEQS